MKTRLAPSLALAAALALGLTGCGLIAPQGTTQPYEASDGIDVTLTGVDVRNLMLITNDDAKEFNVVFTGVNIGESNQRVSIDFADKAGKQLGSANFTVEPGTTVFGGPEGTREVVSLANVIAGSTVTAFVQTQGDEMERQVPVLNGDLQDDKGTYVFPEYRDYTP